jgi:hypothetical protein
LRVDVSSIAKAHHVSSDILTTTIHISQYSTFLSRDFTALVGENMLKVSPQRGAKRNWNVLMKKSSFRIPRAVAPVQCHEAPSHVDSARATAATCLRVSF